MDPSDKPGRPRQRRSESPVDRRQQSKGRAKRHRVNVADIPVVIVPADQMEPNPRNPYNHLSPEERYARFIQILAEVHQELMEAEKAAGMTSGSLI